MLRATNTAEPRTGIGKQLAISAAGESASIITAIGSVLVARHWMPQYTYTLERILGRMLAPGKAWHERTIAGQLATDFLIMNVGGTANLASQYMLHRTAEPLEKLSLEKELLRLLTGRIAGIAGAAGALTIAQRHGVHTNFSRQLSNALPFSDTLGISGLLVSNAVQSAGAVVPNAAAQLLYDRLVPSHSLLIA